MDKIIETCKIMIRNFEAKTGKKPKFVLVSKDIRQKFINEISEFNRFTDFWGIEYCKNSRCPFSIYGVEIAFLSVGENRIEIA